MNNYRYNYKHKKKIIINIIFFYIIFILLLYFYNKYYITGVDVYLAESGDAEDDLALLQDMPSLPKLPWKLPCKEFDNGPGDAGDAVKGDLDLTESVLDLQIQKIDYHMSQWVFQTATLVIGCARVRYKRLLFFFVNKRSIVARLSCSVVLGYSYFQ